MVYKNNKMRLECGIRRPLDNEDKTVKDCLGHKQDPWN